MNDKNFQELKTLRDNLKLKSHLFKKEAQDLWSQTERQLEEYEKKINSLQDASEESKNDILAAIELLGEQLNQSYNKIKNTL